MSLSTTNRDPAEIEKFELSYEQWWNPQGSLKTLHQINQPRLQFIHQQCDLSAKLVLDIGCGGGILSEALAAEAQKVTGIDQSQAAIAAAEQHAQMNHIQNIEYRLETAEQHAEQNPEQYDVISCMELLEHVPQPESVIAATADLLKPGGVAFFSTLNRNLSAYLGAILAAEHILRFIPKGTHDYNKFIKPSELARCCRLHGLELQACSGLAYLPIVEKAFLTRNQNINYLMSVVKPETNDTMAN